MAGLAPDFSQPAPSITNQSSPADPAAPSNRDPGNTSTSRLTSPSRPAPGSKTVRETAPPPPAIRAGPRRRKPVKAGASRRRDTFAACSSQDLRQLAQVDIAARNDADDLSGPGPAAQCRGRRERARSFGDHPGAFGQRAHGGGDLIDRNRQRTVDQRRDERPHAVKNASAARAINE